MLAFQFDPHGLFFVHKFAERNLLERNSGFFIISILRFDSEWRPLVVGLCMLQQRSVRSLTVYKVYALVCH